MAFEEARRRRGVSSWDAGRTKRVRRSIVFVFVCPFLRGFGGIGDVSMCGVEGLPVVGFGQLGDESFDIMILDKFEVESIFPEND